jgi:glutamate-ammonia-ligase adenylyltransferase
MLSLQTVSGRLYEVDMRLRPDGAAGAMVPSIQQMQIYYQQRAWVWELQALVRARCIVGDNDLMQQFNHMRKNILTQKRDLAELKKQVADMRVKMLIQKSSRNQEIFHLKNDRGGITDIEFMVQCMVLAHAHQHPSLCDYSDNIQLLKCLSDLAIIAVSEAQELSDIYRQYRQTMHAQALHAVEAEVSSEEYIPEREIIGKYWQKIIGS